MNAMAYIHAYKFTHFSTDGRRKTSKAALLSTPEKIKALLLGINNPRPADFLLPTVPYSKIQLQSNKKIECWNIKKPDAKGSVIIFHGYGAGKCSMMDKADEFQKLGYNTFLVDFMGSGGSEGNQTTVGFKEAEEVKTCYDYLVKSGEKKIYLFGTSMGAVAILKSISDYNITPTGIILECPFGSMYQTTAARFREMGAPVFPMAPLLVFWGGIQNGFWAFGHNPIEYAKRVNCPTLLMRGGEDKYVSKQETDDIYANLSCPKQKIVYPLAGHENYLVKYKNEWVNDVKGFLRKY